MHPLPLLLGFGSLAIVIVGGWLWRRMSTRPRCPACDEVTSSVTPPAPARMLVPALRIRWCGSCGWQGVSREGPDFDPVRGPAAHDSGFRWSRDGDDSPWPGFDWGESPPEPPAPAHLSGFRWADDEAPGDSADRPRGFTWAEPDPEPRGFVWAETDAAPPEEGESRRGFVWGSRSPSGPKGFRFR